MGGSVPWWALLRFNPRPASSAGRTTALANGMRRQTEFQSTPRLFSGANFRAPSTRIVTPGFNPRPASSAGRTKAPPSALIASQGFNPRPASSAGRTSPRKCTKKRTIWFQSTPRLFSGANRGRQTIAQGCHQVSIHAPPLQRGEQQGRRCLAVCPLVSIHAPPLQRGERPRLRKQWPLKSVSIHAPPLQRGEL